MIQLCRVLCLVLLSGCAMLRLKEDNKRIEELVELSGTVKVDNWSGKPIVLVILRNKDEPGSVAEVERRVAMEEPGEFSFILKPGSFRVGAFEDDNKSFHFDAELGERSGAFQDLAPFTIEKSKKRHIEVTIGDDPPDSFLDLASTAYNDSSIFLEGDVVPLTDKRFDPETASLGLWQPLTFAEQLGMGVFMLEPYDPKRIPVVFVHGMAGHPRQFEALIGCLDKTRYQAWVIQFPSGWRLEPLARGIHRALLQMHLKLGFTQMHMVAHSMGGLLARRILMEHAKRSAAPFITKLVTLASPLGGMPSADKGVESSPVVVPAWRDIGPSSPFVTTLYTQPLPPGTEYALFFGFDTGDSSDGVVQLWSQLRTEAQNEASRVHGFQTTHVKILADKVVCHELNLTVNRPPSDVVEAPTPPASSGAAPLPPASLAAP
jgi:pimeloyl-ACP methyl ester carboxylesterase